MTELPILSGTMALTQGDITTQRVDAIVNAANSSLMGGGGVDGAIHRAGGPSILEECRAIVASRGRLPAGQAVATTGGNLRARFVIHTVGPIWQGGDHGEAATLASAYRESLALSRSLGLVTIAFPSISTGAYGYPVSAAAGVALRTVAAFLSGDPSRVARVVFVLHDDRTFAAYREALAALSATGEVA